MSDPALRDRLATQLDSTVSRRPPAEILSEVPPAARGVQPDGLPEEYSLWQILEHMRICQADYYQFCVDPDYTAPTWPNDYWPDAVAPPTADAWNHSLNQFRRDLQSIKELINDPSIDPAEEIPHADEVQAREGGASYHGSTYADEVAAIADHNAYHLGQFVTVRRLLDAWPPDGVEPPEWVA